MWPLVLAAAITLTGQQNPGPLEFPAGVRVIRLDVSVVDDTGQAVSGLGLEDFEVLECCAPITTSLTAYLPRDVPMRLDLRFSQGGGEVDLGGL